MKKALRTILVADNGNGSTKEEKIYCLFLIFFRKNTVRQKCLEIWPANNIPQFKNQPENIKKLEEILNDLKEFAYEEVGFSREAMKTYVFNMFTERRRKRKLGTDFTKVFIFELYFNYAQYIFVI